MEPAEGALKPTESPAKATRWPNPHSRGLRRLAFVQTLKDPATAIYAACAVPALIVLPAAPLIILSAPAFVLALWRVKYLELTDSPPAHLCARCLYDMRGLAAPLCPECGQLRVPPPASANS